MEELCGAEWSEVGAPAVEGFESFLGPLLQAPIANGTIGYRRFGNTRSNRPALIMATGFGQTMGSWADGTLRTLAKRQEVIIFDHRGMGQSADYAKGMLSIDGMAQDVMQFVQVLDLAKKPSLLGLSMGGFVAVAVAAQYGDAFNSFIVVAGSAGGPHSEMPTPFVQNELLNPAITAIQLRNLSFPLDKPEGRQAACEFQYTTVAVGPSQRNNTTFYRQIGAILTRFVMDTDTWEAVPSIQNDVLIITGDDDIIVPPSNSRALAERLPHPWLTVFPNAGHGVMAQYREDIVDLIDVFLAWSARSTANLLA